MKNILFDMDGVLLDSEPVITQAAIMGLKEFGVDAITSDFHEFTGMGEDRFIGGVAEKHGVVYQIEMKKRVYEIYLDIVDNGSLTVFPSTKPTLEALRYNGFRLALASSADHIKIAANLRVAKLDNGIFDVIIGGEDAKHKKPDPEIYLIAAARLGVNPAECFVVEDAISGVLSGKAAGCTVIAVSGSFSKMALLEAGADIYVQDIGDVPKAIETLTHFV